MPDDKAAAIVVLPAVAGGRLADARLRMWLARAELDTMSAPRGTLASILEALDRPMPATGLAALRLWGQTGDRPTVWIAAADPVYLEPRLDHLCLHALGSDAVPMADLRGLFDHLQATLAPTSQYGFARIGRFGYLRSTVPIATAKEPTYVVDYQPPNEHMPVGDESAAYRSLISEVEMALHDHDVNANRAAAGLPPVNSLWLWGGGMAPEVQTNALPSLFTADPLLRGYWFSNTGVVAAWPGSIAACVEDSVAGFVAVPPFAADDADSLQLCLQELRQALRSKRLSSLLLLFRDGIRARVRRTDALRIWRRGSGLLE